MAANKKEHKDKEQGKRNSRKQVHANIKNSRLGISSCIYAGASLVMIALLIFYSYYKRGDTVGILGALGIVDIFLTMAGIHTGFRGIKEREKRHITCILGILANSFICLSLVFIFLGGF